jgi:sulfate transport system substrate-binding protein
VLKASPNKDKANEFLRYLKTPPAQELFAQNGFRPVVESVLEKHRAQYPARPGIFRVDDRIIGGWRHADDVWFDAKHGRMVQIERAVGGPAGR